MIIDTLPHALASTSDFGTTRLVEILDEVASGVAFDNRWITLRAELLDDPDLADTLLLATVVEAMTLGRDCVGIEYEDRWAALAALNIVLAEKQGATGTGEVYTGDSRQLPSLLPPHMRGRVALVVTSPPYGASTHGHVRTPGPRRGKVRKLHHRYGGSDNLAYRDHDTLAAGFTDILAGCRAVLRPGGHVAITARPYRRHGELVDIPGMVVASGQAAGLELVEECVALMAGVRDGVLVPRASFFQIKNVGDAVDRGDPQWIPQHEDVLVLRRPTAGHEGEGAHG